MYYFCVAFMPSKPERIIGGFVKRDSGALKKDSYGVAHIEQS